MKYVSVKLAFILLGAVMLLATACEIIVNGSFYDISGSVVNIKSADKDSSSYLPNARITFTNVKNGDEYSTTASSSGSYSLLDLPDGRYRVTGSKDNWTFIPQLYSATGSTSTSDLDIFAYIEEDPTTITVAVAWDNINYDIDLVATYGPNSVDQFDDYTLTDREIVNYNNPDSRNSSRAEPSVGYRLTHDRDVRDTDSSSVPRVETMTIKNISGPYAGPTKSDDFRALDTEELRFYADAHTPVDGLTGVTAENVAPAYATLYVMLGSEHYGTWYAPIETAEETIHFINIALYNASNGKKAAIFSAGNYGDEIFRSVY